MKNIGRHSFTAFLLVIFMIISSLAVFADEPEAQLSPSGKTLTIVRGFDDADSLNAALEVGASFTYEVQFATAGEPETSSVTLGVADYDADSGAFKKQIAIPSDALGYTVAETNANVGGYHSYTPSAPTGDNFTFEITEQSFGVVTYSYNGSNGYNRAVSAYTAADALSLMGKTQYLSGGAWNEVTPSISGEKGDAAVTLPYETHNGKYYLNRGTVDITKNSRKTDGDNKDSIIYMSFTASAPISKTSSEYKYAKREKKVGIKYWDYSSNNKDNARAAVDGLLSGYVYSANTDSTNFEVDNSVGTNVKTDRYSQYYLYTNPIEEYRYVYEAVSAGVKIYDSTASFSGTIERKNALLTVNTTDEGGNTLGGVEYALYDGKTGARIPDITSPLDATAEGYTLRVLSVPSGYNMPSQFDYSVVFDAANDCFVIENTADSTIKIPNADGAATIFIKKTFDTTANADLQKTRGLIYSFDIFADNSDTPIKVSTDGTPWTATNGGTPGFFTVSAALPVGTLRYEAVECTRDGTGIAASDGVYTSSPVGEASKSGEVEAPCLRYNYTEYPPEGETSTGIIKASELNLLVNAGGRYYIEDGAYKAATESDGKWYGYYSTFKLVEDHDSFSLGFLGSVKLYYVRYSDDKGNNSEKWYYTDLSVSISDINLKKNKKDAISAALSELYERYYITNGRDFFDGDTSRPRAVDAYTLRTVRAFDTASPVTGNDIFIDFTNTVKLLPATVALTIKSEPDVDGARLTSGEIDGFSANLYRASDNAKIEAATEKAFNEAKSSITFTFSDAFLEPKTAYYVKLDSRPDSYIKGEIRSDFTTDDTSREFTAPDKTIKPTSLTIKLTDDKGNPIKGGKFEVSPWEVTGNIFNADVDKKPVEYTTDENGLLTVYKLRAGHFDYTPTNLHIIVVRVKQTGVADEDIYERDEHEYLVYIEEDGKIAKAGYGGKILETAGELWNIVKDGADGEPLLEYTNKIVSGSLTVTLHDSEKKVDISDYAFGYLPRGAKIQLCDAGGELLTDFTGMFIVDGKNGDFTDNGDGTYSLTDVKLPKNTDVTLYYRITKYPDGYYADVYGGADAKIYSVTLTRGDRDRKNDIELDPIHITFDKFGYEDIWDNGEGEPIDGAQFVLLSADMKLDTEALIALIRDLFDDFDLSGVSDALKDFDFSKYDITQLLKLLNSLTSMINLNGDYSGLIPTVLFAESDENGRVDFTNFILPTSYIFTGDGVLADILDFLNIDINELYKKIAEKVGGLILDNIKIPDWLEGVRDLLKNQGAKLNLDQFIGAGDYLLYEIRTGVGASGEDEYGRGFLIWRVTVNADGSVFIAPGKYSAEIAGWLEPYEELFGLSDGQINAAITPVQIDGRAYNSGTHFKMKNFIEKGLLILDAVDDETKLIIRNFLFENVDFDALGRGEFDNITSIDELREKLNDYISGLGDYLITRIYEAEVEYKIYKKNDEGVYPDTPEMYLLHKNGYWFASSDGESYDETVKFKMMFRRGDYLVVTETAPKGYVTIPNGNTLMPGTDAVEFSIPNEYLDLKAYIGDDYYRYVPASSFGFIPGNLVRVPYKATAVAVIMLSPLPILDYDVGDTLTRDILIADATSDELKVKSKLFVLYRNYKWKEFDLAGENIALTDDEIAALTETPGVKLLHEDGKRYIPLTWTDEINGKVFDDEIFFDVLFNVWVYGQSTITVTQKQPVYYLDDFYSLGLYINYFISSVGGSRILPEVAFYYDEECTNEISFFGENNRREDPLPVGHYYYKISVAQDDGFLPPDFDQLWRGAEKIVGFDIKPRPIALQIDSIQNGINKYLPYSAGSIINGDTVGEYGDTLTFNCTVRRMAVFNATLIPFALPIPSRATDFDGAFFAAVYSQSGLLVDYFPIERANGESKLSFTRLQAYISKAERGLYRVVTFFVPNDGSNYTQLGLEDIYKIGGSFSKESDFEEKNSTGYPAAIYSLSRRVQTLTLFSEGGAYASDGDTLTVPFSSGAFKLSVSSNRSGESDFDSKFEYELVSGSCVTVSADGTVKVKGLGEAVVRVKASGSELYQDAYDELTIKIVRDDAFSDPTSPLLFARFHNVTAKAVGSGSVTNAGVSAVCDGDTLNFVCTPADGFKLSDIIIDGVSVGAKMSFPLEAITSDHTVEAIFIPDNTVKVMSFTDVGDGDSFGGAVAYLTENGIIKGISETEFGPYLSLTRGMFVTLLGRCAGIDTVIYGGSSFSDVPLGSYYSPYIEWANGCGIVLGYGDSRFGPDDPLTREQMLTITARFTQIYGGKAIKSGGFDYIDSSDISDWARDSVAFCAANGYISSTGELRPRDYAKRCEVAEILYAYIMSR